MHTLDQNRKPSKISDFKEMNICVAVEEIVLHLVRFLRLVQSIQGQLVAKAPTCICITSYPDENTRLSPFGLV